MSQCIYYYCYICACVRVCVHACVRACVRKVNGSPLTSESEKLHFSRSELHATWRVPLAMPAIALATGKIASLLDMWVQLDMELYTFKLIPLWWPV